MNYINAVPKFVKSQAIVLKESVKTAVLGIGEDCVKIYNNNERMASLQDIILKVVGVGGIAFGFYLTFLNIASLALLPNVFSEIGALHAVITMISLGYTFLCRDAITISENLKKSNRTYVLDGNVDVKNFKDQVQDMDNKERNVPGIITGTYLAATKDAITRIFKKVINCFRFSSIADVSNPRASSNNKIMKLMVISLIMITALLYNNFQQNAAL